MATPGIQGPASLPPLRRSTRTLLRSVRPRLGVILGALLVFSSAGIHAGTIQRGGGLESRLPEDGLCFWSNPAVTGPGAGSVWQGRFYDPGRDGFRNVIRPLPLAFLRMEYSAFGESATPYRVTQLILLGGVGVLLFLLLVAWCGSVFGAAFGAMFFVVHPLSVPAVSEVAGVSSLLALVFFLGALWLARARKGMFAASGLVFLAALSNEMAFAAIPAIGVWAWAQSRVDGADPEEESDGEVLSRAERRLRRGFVTVFALGSGLAGFAALLYRAAMLWTRPQNLKIAEAVEAWTGVGLGKRILVSLAGVFESFRLIVFPVPIGYSNDYLLTSALTPLRAAAGVLLCVGMVWGLWRTVRGAAVGGRGIPGERAAAGAFWMAIVLFSVIGASGLFFPTGAILPHRALLFVLAGAAGLVVWGGRWVFARRATKALRGAFPILGAAILGLACWRTIDRTGDYQSWEILVQRQTIEFPRSAQGWFDLGNIRLTRGDRAAARAAYDEALTQRSDYWEAWVNLGAAYYDDEERGLAMRAFTQAVDGTAGKKDLRVVFARARFHQGLVYMTQTKNVDAARCFEDMLAVFPDHLYSHANLGMLYSNSEYLDDRARMHLERALQLETDPERRVIVEKFLDGLAKRRARKERQKERISGGNTPGAIPVDSLP
jgi:tetratricopeptide (TPR) repeat protein